MALSGNCKTGTWSGTTYSGYLQFNWSATQDKSKNQSKISWNIKAMLPNGGWITYSELSVQINGSSVYYRAASNHTDCSNGTQLASGTKTITHNANGTASFTVSIGAGIYYSSINETGSGSFTLNTIPTYTLSVSAGTGSTITVNRTSSGYASTGTITNGTRLYYGDKLTITFAASSGYGLSTHTVNGSSFTSGGSHTVSANVSVASTALAAYTLSISAGTGSSITVSRTSSSVTGTGTLSNGATIYKNDTLKITFTASTNYEILTHTVNGSAFTSGNTHTVSGNVSVVSTARVLSSSVGASDANIESRATITITRYDASYKHSLRYSFGSLSGYITASGGTSSSEVKFGDATSVSFLVPSTFYAQIPNAKSGTCTITCKTYDSTGSTQLGNATTCTFKATADPELCAPTVTGTVEDDNVITLMLTRDASSFVRYQSTAKCVIDATANNSATIVSRTINNQPATESSGIYSTTETNVESTKFVFVATDSRGYTSKHEVSTDALDPEDRIVMINYVPLTCNPTVTRTTPTGSEIDVYLTGNYYYGSFGYVSNTLDLSYQYKESTSATWSALTQVSSQITYDGTSYSTSFTIDTQDPLAYQKVYEFRFYARDGHVVIGGEDRYLTSLQKNVTLVRGIPVFDWGQSDFSMNVDMTVNGDLDVNGDIKRNGSSAIVKTKYIGLSSVPITNQSVSGAYYSSSYDPADYNIDGIVIGILIVGWTGATASFVPYYQDRKIRFMSDISQTVSTIGIFVSYL